MRGFTRQLLSTGIATRRGAVLALGALLIAGLAALPLPASAQGPDKARQVVNKVAEVGISEVVGADLPQAEKIARFRNLFVTYFDVPSIGRFVLGRNWRTASPAEQDQFLELFKEVNVFTWARRFGDYSGQDLVIGQATPDGDAGAIVNSSVEQTGGQQPIQVQWRLRERGDTYKVVDLVIEGVSMAITYRQEYNAVIQQSGGSVAALNERLASQLARLKAEQGM
ncbi:MAG: ABC transporter substrate-binding protein [Rhodospirillaceae bacterium]